MKPCWRSAQNISVEGKAFLRCDQQYLISHNMERSDGYTSPPPRETNVEEEEEEEDERKIKITEMEKSVRTSKENIYLMSLVY